MAFHKKRSKKTVFIIKLLKLIHMDYVLLSPNNGELLKKAYQMLLDGGVKDSLEEYKNKIVSYNFNIVNVNGEDCLLLDTRDIDFVIEEYEE